VTILSNSVQYLKGVGPKRALFLERLGLRTLEDLLYYFPRDWQDRRETKDLSLPTATGLVVAKGRVVRSGLFPAGRSLALFKATIATGEKKIEATWFKHLNRRFDVFAGLKNEVSSGTDLWIIGRAEPSLVGIREILVDEHYLLADERWTIHVDRLTPLYPLTEGVSQRFLRELVHQVLLEGGAQAPDALPASLISRRGLLAVPQALHGIHFPGSQAELDAARTRLAYDELLLLELAWILKRRQTREVNKGFAYTVKRTLLTPFKERLGFELTNAQKHVINEIFEDLRKTYPMTRLLQGDVGSGKTVVALSALLLAVENGHQGAFMAPTEILAEQHFATMSRYLQGMPVKIALLTSRVKAKEREKILAGVRSGEVQILVGTHALLESEVQFPKLKLAVIDEQHRFGVRQRATLRQKSSMLDLLIMTATPIPRTLALALYGDLDVSTLDQMPPGKVTAETFLAPESEALEHLKAEVAKGRQAYVVYPIIEESSRLDLQSAKAEFERLKEGPLKGLKVALIHGALAGKQKAAVMADFADKKTDVLIATPVIEVGIDVPNATVMIIQNADRFGLASLHQLRGRIGRGSHASRCYLVGEAKTEQARTRLQTLVDSADGFRIGEEDLKLRGPGEFLGTAQHGSLTLKVADLVKDAPLLKLAREDAEGMLSEDPKLAAPPHAALRKRLIALYQERWNWIDLA
jgi:ATP-dependent DNA helicase RecG